MEVYIYNKDFELINYFTTTQEAAEFYNFNYKRFQQYMSFAPDIIYKKRHIIPSRHDNAETAKEKYNNILQHKQQKREENQKIQEAIGNVETREQLQLLADFEGITINWKKWDELVQQTKKEIENILKKQATTNKTKVYQYNKNFQLINTFKSILEATQYFNITYYALKKAIENNEIIDNSILSYFNLNEITTLERQIIENQEKQKRIERFQQKVNKQSIDNNNKKNRPVYVYSLEGELLHTLHSMKDAARLYNIKQETVSVYIRLKKPYQKEGIYFTQTKIIQ